MIASPVRRQLLPGIVALIAVALLAWWLLPSTSGPEVGASLSEPLAEGYTEAASSGMNVPSPVAAAAGRTTIEVPEAEPAPERSLEAWLLEITAAERGVIANGGRDLVLHQELEADLEEAVGAVMATPGNLQVLLGMLAGSPDGTLGLTEDLQYGTVRALYWWVVVSAGRQAEREVVIAILSALAKVHPDVVDYLIDNLVEARVDGRLILDSSYLQIILNLRSAYPEMAARYSRLFEVVGEGMTAEQRTQFFSLFLEDKDDPALVGLTIKGLLTGSDPTLGLLLAGSIADDKGLTRAVRTAAARAVATNADVFSATEFLADRGAFLRNEPSIWFGLGFREGSNVAISECYQELASSGAEPKVRMMLVSAMRGATGDQLLEIARSETDSKVAGQALLTASAGRGQDLDDEAILDFLDSRRGLDPLAGGLSPIYVTGVANNLAREAKKYGPPSALERAIGNLEAVARDPNVRSAYRRSAVEDLRPYVPAPLIQELMDQIE